MQYKTSELRNTYMSLLRRIQRQVDKQNEIKAAITIPKEKEKVKGISFNILSNEDCDFEIFKPKKTRLDLYSKRRGR